MINLIGVVVQRELDDTTFENLFNEHYSWLCYVAAKVTKNKDLARDFVQDFFVYYWRNREHVQIGGSFKSYATKAVLNIAVSYLEKEKIRELIHIELYLGEDENWVDNEEKIQEYEERYKKLFIAIGKLPVQRRRILVLHQFGKLKYDDIAEKLQLSKNTVKTHLKLAYRELKRLNIS